MDSWLTLPGIVLSGTLIMALDAGRNERGPRPDEQHWVGGVFYYNRADPRLVVPKRRGIGGSQGLNFGHPLSWIIVLVPVVLAAVIAASGRG